MSASAWMAVDLPLLEAVSLTALLEVNGPTRAARRPPTTR